jgi:transcriptional regulator with XRE-family HTH domain
VNYESLQLRNRSSALSDTTFAHHPELPAVRDLRDRGASTMPGEGELAALSDERLDSFQVLERYQPALGRRLAQLREKSGFAREEAASMIGVSTDTLRSFEDASWRPSMPRVVRLARLYGTNLLELLADVTERVRPGTPDDDRVLHGLLLFCGITPEQVLGDVETDGVELEPADRPLGDVVRHLRSDHPVRVRGGMTIRREYEAGASIRALSARHGLAFGTVRNLLVEAGATLRGQGGAHTAGR